MAKTYRFVKAEERLPEKKGEYFVYMVHDNDLPEDGKTKCYTIFDGSVWDAAEGWSIIEWLEETPKDERQKEGVTLERLYRVVLEKVYGEELRIWQMMNDVNIESDMGPIPKSSLLQLVENTLQNNLQSPESGEQDELKKENTRLRVIQQEVYVKTDNPWQSDLDATAYDGKQYHFDKHTGYFHTKEQLVELLRGAYRAGRNFEYAEHYGGVPNQYPIETTYVDQIINP